MNPNTQRAEAERWLAIAAKLLKAHDFNGSKTFAIRVRESDPSNAISDQILAVVDTLLAAETKINAQFDWYSILGLPHLSRDPDLVSNQYRQLVLLLNPDRNRFPFADYALRLVVDAWSVLSDPTKKWMYDSELGLYLQRFEAQRVEPPRVDPAPQLNTFQFFQQQPQQWQQGQQVEQRQQPQFHVGERHNEKQHRQGFWRRQQQPQPQQQRDLQWEQLHRPSQQPQHHHQQKDQQENVGRRNEDPEEERSRGADASKSNGDANGTVEIETFWTACPYCFYIYEYPQVYEDCTLRCQNCRRCFHAAEIPNPPPIRSGGGKEESFCCWGFYPMGFSVTKWKRNNKIGDPPDRCASWVPFSPMFTCPVKGNGIAGGPHAIPVGEKNIAERKTGGSGIGKNVVVDKVVVLDDLSDSGIDSDSSTDIDWGKTKKKWKKSKVGKVGRRGSKPNALMEKGNESLTTESAVQVAENSQVRSQVTESAIPVSGGMKADASKRPGNSSARKHTGRVVKDRGKLDLNVELSNEVEDHAPILNAGNGQEEPIEGIGFFEGLDEFLSSFPILNVVGDEKVKPS